jgi:hypothetical protein
MASSQAFDQVCQALEEASSLNRLEARGTVRLALKEGGLDANTVTPAEMKVVVKRLLPRELESRGIADVPSICDALCSAVDLAASPSAASERPDAVFQRLADVGEN